MTIRKDKIEELSIISEWVDLTVEEVLHMLIKETSYKEVLNCLVAFKPEDEDTSLSMFKVWTEWDVGLEDSLFTSELAAKHALDVAFKRYKIYNEVSDDDKEYDGEYLTCVDDVLKANLCRIDSATLD